MGAARYVMSCWRVGLMILVPFPRTHFLFFCALSKLISLLFFSPPTASLDKPTALHYKATTHAATACTRRGEGSRGQIGDYQT